MADLSVCNAKQLATFDREVQEFRSWFGKANPDQRVAFRRWLAELAPVVARQPEPLRFSVSCRVNNLQTDEGGEVTYDGVVYLSPKAMLAAITAWEAGEEFLPNHWMELL